MEKKGTKSQRPSVGIDGVHLSRTYNKTKDETGVRTDYQYQAFQKMSTLKFGEQEAGEELLSAALYVEEGQDGDEGAPQDGMSYLRCPASIIVSITLH